MVIAALASFGILLVAWILAPERREESVSVKPIDASEEALPVAA